MDFVSSQEAETQVGNTEEVSRIPKQFQEKFRTMMEGKRQVLGYPNTLKGS